ncbi:MAG: single-stranded DNA-binding protein [Acidobacteriota bacterium]|nr:single-stranded DNA-binding protein [Acidobacteriota bacterium]
MSFNKIILVGNLGRDPELRYTPQGTPVCSFTMATNEKRKGGAGEQQDVTTWFRVTIWGQRAEVASKYLTKGSPVYIEGRLRLEEWTDRDGKTRQTLDVQATEMQFIGSNRPADEGGFGGRGDDFSGESSRSESRFENRPPQRNAAPAASRNYDDFDQSGASDEDIPF